ncbi:MAG TPA: hypothetical protein VFK41_11080 [Nocardioidaceae bacterium]|nr:hypothetical protein [Nocardioidaceae bacterium]
MDQRRSRVGYAHVTATLALVIALGGTAHAAGLIGSRDVKNGSLTGVDVKNGSLTTDDVRNGTLRRADLAPGVLPPGPGETVAAGTQLRGVLAPTSQASGGPTGSGEGITFQNPLPVAPRAHVVLPDSTPIAECPGSVTAPTALSGHLCLYVVAEQTNLTQLTVLDPSSFDLRGINLNVDTDVETVYGDGKTSPLGFSLTVSSTSNVAQVAGTWAVRG